MDAPSRTQKQRSDRTKQAILDATIRCIVKSGYAGASTTEICKAAGASRGAMLHHYPSKQLLVAAAIERLFEQRHQAFRKKLAGIEDQGLRIDAAIDALWDIYSGPTLYAWMELVTASRTDPDLRVSVAAVDQRFFVEARQTFDRVFGDNLPAATAAAATRLLTSLFDGLALHNVLKPDPKVIEGVLSLFKQMARSLMQ